VSNGGATPVKRAVGYVLAESAAARSAYR